MNDMTSDNNNDYTTGTVFDYSKKKASKKSFSAIEMSAAVKANEASSFDQLQIHGGIKEAVGKLGWTKPTPVQGLCLPFTLQGKDVAGFAQTGTGKTGVFLLTLAQRLTEEGDAKSEEQHPRAIVLAPTRELAMQIADDAKPILDGNGLRSIAIFGGVDYDKQAKQLRDGVDVIIATPGRLKDYCKKKVVDLSKIEVFICDEADRMFDMGFIEDVEYFLDKIDENAQKLLFSATTNEEVKELAFEYLNEPEYISVNPEEITPDRITQKAIHVNSVNKLKVMLGLLKDHDPECSIIFTNTKLTAEWLHYKLSGNGIDVDLMSGALAQSKRIRLIQKIKEGKIKALIATDVASRGLHISRVSHVYNFDIPDDPSNYIHRIGRTARAGAKGAAYSLICDDYGQNFPGITELLGDAAQIQSEWYSEDYLKIEDKAGDPFANRKSPSSDSDRPARSTRSGGDSQRPGGDRKGGSSNKPSRGRDEQKARGARGGKGRNDRNDRKGPKGKNANRSNKPHNKQAPKAAAKSHKGTPQAAAAKGSVGGLFKKMIKSILGK